MTVEDLGASAYLGAAREIKDPDVLTAAVAIHNIEGEHASIWRRAAKLAPVEGAFATPTKRADVLAAVTPFLGGGGAAGAATAAPAAAATTRPAATGTGGGTGATTAATAQPRRALRQRARAAAQQRRRPVLRAPRCRRPATRRATTRVSRRRSLRALRRSASAPFSAPAPTSAARPRSNLSPLRNRCISTPVAHSRRGVPLCAVRIPLVVKATQT